MTHARTILWLAVASIALVAANLYVEFAASEVRRLPRTTLMDMSFSPTRLKMERPGRPTVELELKGEWCLVKPYNARSDSQRVLRLIDALAFSIPEDTITEGELFKLGRQRSHFGLDTPRLKVTVESPIPKQETASISFGDYTASSNGVYAIVDGSDVVCAVPIAVFSIIDLADSDFRSREVFPTKEESVISFSVKLPGAPPFEFTRNHDGWNTKDGPSSASKVNAYLSRLFEAEAKSFVWPVGGTNESASVSTALLSGYGLDPETALTVVLRGYDGEVRRVSFGAAADESNVYALVQNGGAVITVDSSIRDAARTPPVQSANSRLFPFEVSAVSAFSLSTESLTCALSRGKEGAWLLESPVVAPADLKTVEGVLARILALPHSADVKSSDSISVSFGTNTSSVAISRSKVFGSLRLEDLRSKEMVRFDPAVVSRLVSTVQGKTASVVYSREKGMWIPDGDAAAEVNAAGVNKVLSAINPLVAVRVENLKASASDLSRYGLDVPRLILAVDRADEGSVRRNILVGGPAKSGYYATVGSADAIFVISHSAVNALMSQLLKK